MTPRHAHVWSILTVCGFTLMPSNLVAQNPKPISPAMPAASTAVPAPARPASATPAPTGPLTLKQDIPGDCKPIIMHAGEISTWMEGRQRVILLNGVVLIEHGVVTVRTKKAVAWIDLDHRKVKGIYRVLISAEGDVRFERGTTEQKSGERAEIELCTRGELIIRSQDAKVGQLPRQNDALYQMASRQRKSGDIATVKRDAPGTIQPAGYQQKPIAQPLPPQVSNPNRPGYRSNYQPPEARGQSPNEPPVETAPIPLPVPPQTAPGAQGPGPPAGAAPAPQPQPFVGLSGGPPRQLRIVPRTPSSFQEQSIQLPTGEQAFLVTGGVILTIAGEGQSLLDIEADQLIVWTKSNIGDMFSKLKSKEGGAAKEIEFYLAGNVEIRERSGGQSRTLKADEVYYDVGRNVAVAYQADLEFIQPGLPDPVHLRADELLQISPKEFKAVKAEVFSSRLPSDPGFKIYVAEAHLQDKKVVKRSPFGWTVKDRTTGEPKTAKELLFRGRNIFLEVDDFPIFYFPYLQGDALNPLGPLKSVNFKYDRVFGAQFYTSWNLYDLFGIDPNPNTEWRGYLDYLTARGPAIGTDYTFFGNELFGIEGKYSGLFRAYGMYDDGTDILGGNRGMFDNHPLWRGRIVQRLFWELPDGFQFQTQLGLYSDKNFYEQYWKDEFDRDVNQSTYLYLKQQQGNWAWSILGEKRIRNWVTETDSLPRVDGYLLGQSFFDLFTYNAHFAGSWSRLVPTNIPPPPVMPTDVRLSVGRVDLWQELAMPFTAGPFRIVPYGVFDATYYSKDIELSEIGRLYGGGGVRGSIPLSRLYPSVQSDLFNINGINHKIVWSNNYYNVTSSQTYANLPQLDRINDDATDQALRDITPQQPMLNPPYGYFLQTSPLYNGQTFAIRKMIQDRIDTLDSLEVLQTELRQRWQTKRGYPGMQHTIDYITLDMSASWFPHTKRDNFGEPFAFCQYDFVWNVGDRTSLLNSLWIDPIDNGARVYTVGGYFNRPDRTDFYVGYRQIDPLRSKAVTGAASYVFSPKYAMTFSSTYDFGTQQSLSNSFIITRMGSDLRLSFGINYNAMVNNFGVTLEIMPNVVPNRRSAGIGSALLAR